ncbi:MAG: hypothetical protein IPN51_14485 [Chloracidobacterium sp.]|nr:hypothetical protein [Chloracidobacterium sp.]
MLKRVVRQIKPVLSVMTSPRSMGEKLEDINFLRNKVAQTSPGTAIKLTCYPGWQEVKLTATLDELNTDDKSKGSIPRVNPDLRNRAIKVANSVSV